MMARLAILGHILYFLSYPFWWLVGLPVFIVLVIGKTPIFSWPLALVFWYFYSLGFRSDIPILYTNILIETGEENALMFLIAALVAMPFFARKLYDSILPRGIWAFIKDPLNFNSQKKKNKTQKQKKIQPVRVIVPPVKPESIRQTVTRLPPHLQRLISGIDQAENP